jgi:hypothetical protein
MMDLKKQGKIFTEKYFKVNVSILIFRNKLIPNLLVKVRPNVCAFISGANGAWIRIGVFKAKHLCVSLKELSHEIDFKTFDKNLQNLA